MGPMIWELVPQEMKQVTILNEFKAKIKIWKLETVPYDSLKLSSTDRFHYMSFTTD